MLAILIMLYYYVIKKHKALSKQTMGGNEKWEQSSVQLA